MDFIKLICIFLLFGCAVEPQKMAEFNTSDKKTETIEKNDVSSTSSAKTKSIKKNPFGDHIGAIEPAFLLSEFSAFKRQYQRYQIKQSEIDALNSIAKPLEIIVIFGTWCHDSKREVARYIKLMNSVNNPLISTKYWAVDRDKKDPENFAQEYKLLKTPTFIIFSEGRELGRIIERPEDTLVKDLMNIL
jgi:thiol-disulfide isomerase/thioredoxin